MYKRYVKTNSEDYIYDLFHERQKDRFDGTEKYLDEVESPADVWINGKGIFDEAGNPLFKYNSGSPVEAPNTTKILKFVKKAQKDLISKAFDSEFESGHFMSSAIGIEVDCRRYDKKNDAQNVDGMIADYDNLTDIEKYYVGYSSNSSAPLTLAQLEELKLEMVRTVKSWYMKKRTRHAQIDQATTVEAVKAIGW